MLGEMQIYWLLQTGTDTFEYVYHPYMDYLFLAIIDLE